MPKATKKEKNFVEESIISDLIKAMADESKPAPKIETHDEEDADDISEDESNESSEGTYATTVDSDDDNNDSDNDSNDSNDIVWTINMDLYALGHHKNKSYFPEDKFMENYGVNGDELVSRAGYYENITDEHVPRELVYVYDLFGDYTAKKLSNLLEKREK